MKKVYCFNCQKDVMPYKLWKWRFCPHCWRQTKDNGDGVYFVCDKCGANMPLDTGVCPKCGQGDFSQSPRDTQLLLSAPRTIIDTLIRFGLFGFSLFIAAVIIYMSFYLLLAGLVFGLGYYLYNMLRRAKF